MQKSLRKICLFRKNALTLHRISEIKRISNEMQKTKSLKLLVGWCEDYT